MIKTDEVNKLDLSGPAGGDPSRVNRQMVVTRAGGPEVLQLVERPLPEPQAGEVRVKVLAAGISAYDLMYRSARWMPGRPKLPFALGEDIVGLVDKVGAGVTAFAPDQLVAGVTFALGVGGGYAESVCLPASWLVPVPAGVDPAEAVCVVVNYLTAHMALFTTAQVQPGERVLVHGAAGGVGSALLDLGRMAGLELYGTASSGNHAHVRAFGGTPIDYRNEDFVARIRELTGDGVDVVFDPIGGARQLWRSYRALRPGGRLAWFGVAATKQHGLRVIPATLLMLGLLKFIPDGKATPLAPDLSADNAWYRATLIELLDQLAQGQLTPLVAARLPLAEAAEGHRLLERGGYAGKVVLCANGYAG